MAKVFLKYNRTDSFSLVCLKFWLELFKHDNVFIVCDLFDANRSIPENLKNLIGTSNVKFINTDYSTGSKLPFKSKKKKMASANITCWKYLTSSDQCFWIIDADDTMFLSFNYQGIRDKLHLVEIQLLKENLSAYSLDFYREQNNAWTFGVCCVNASTDVNQIMSINTTDIEKCNLPLNFDSIFDVLGRRGTYKLKSFVLNDCGFQHLINNFRKLPGGIYYWKNRKLWDIPLLDDVEDI